jgi:hypothetical protein
MYVPSEHFLMPLECACVTYETPLLYASSTLTLASAGKAYGLSTGDHASPRGDDPLTSQISDPVGHFGRQDWVLRTLPGVENRLRVDSAREVQVCRETLHCKRARMKGLHDLTAPLLLGMSIVWACICIRRQKIVTSAALFEFVPGALHCMQQCLWVARSLIPSSLSFILA